MFELRGVDPVEEELEDARIDVGENQVLQVCSVVNLLKASGGSEELRAIDDEDATLLVLNKRIEGDADNLMAGDAF